MKRVFYTIWMAWSMIVFFTSLAIVTPIYFILLIPKTKEAEERGHKLSRIWAYYLLFMFGIQMKVIGRNILDSQANYVFISNHCGTIDIPICAIASTHFFKFLAKEELTKVPLLGYIIKRLYITVSRGSGRDRAKSLVKMKEELNRGVSVWLFPEGTRNKTNEPISDFHDGAFQVAASAGKPIGVLTIIGVKDILPLNTVFQLKPGKIIAYWDVIESSKDVQDLKEKAREIMKSRLSSK